MEVKDFINKLSSELLPAELLVLYCINNKDEYSYNKLLESYGESIKRVNLSLENKFYIKIQGNSFEDMKLRDNGEKLFIDKSVEKDITEIIEYLSLKSKKKRGFSTKSPGNRRHVSGRLHDGYSKEDLMSVIDTMCNKWLGTGWEDYLRPETLFNDTKFQSYINLADEFGGIEDDWTIDKV